MSYQGQKIACNCATHMLPVREALTDSYLGSLEREDISYEDRMNTVKQIKHNLTRERELNEDIQDFKELRGIYSGAAAALGGVAIGTLIVKGIEMIINHSKK